jgi:peptidoglycan/LPS O-acetylase OafA/YrhL
MSDMASLSVTPEVMAFRRQGAAGEQAAPSVPSAAPRPAAPTLGYRPELDSLRCIAVLGVLYSHFWNDGSMLGSLGVRLFFVLSGFLITDILLGLRERAQSPREKLRGLASFFVRRALRIWPAYYTALLVAVAFNIQDIRDVWVWHALFGSNFLFSIRNDYIPWVTAAWWSLSIEEQFYLAWPTLMLLPRTRLVPWIIGILIYVGILFHFGVAYIGDKGLSGSYLTPAAFGALGSGAALAYLRHRHGAIPRAIEYVGWLALPIVAIMLYTSWFDWEWNVLSVLPMVAAIAWGVRGGSSTVRRVMTWSPFRWIGKISYGIYVYHLFFMALLFAVAPTFPIFATRGPALFAAGLVLSLLTASASWLLLEGPCNNLKRFFPYTADRQRH